ncbi:hypothetical protein NSMM_260117 [Nitrosomonas mobilis]|uniref:Uncharacterized protein n=1 Tax=Nitrosomonas mobilis TaxID=51642 RepID=A0A1G5SE47_9PROT|nr:hypothetical protein NSMM_260117 [Nitrosomonas mobilis]
MMQINYNQIRLNIMQKEMSDMKLRYKGKRRT